MEAIKKIIIDIIISRPINTALVKASYDFVFSSVYIFLVGMVVIGIINLSMRIKGGSKRKINAVNATLFSALVVIIILANILFYFVRN